MQLNERIGCPASVCFRPFAELPIRLYARSLNLTVAEVWKLGLSEQRNPAPKRFQVARRWQWFAAAASAIFVLACFIGWRLGYFWPSAIGFVGFLPSVWVFSIKCYNCGWPAFTNYEAQQKLKREQRFWTRFWGKEYGGVMLPLPRACSKCGASFV